jgi:hypothetical protein
MLGWPNHPIGGGRFGLGVVRPPPDRPSMGGRTTPRAQGDGLAAPWAKPSKDNLWVWP